MNALKAAGAVPKWGCESPESGAAGTTRQNKFNGELKMAGIKVGVLGRLRKHSLSGPAEGATTTVLWVYLW
jgi:hypothetical protein